MLVQQEWEAWNDPNKKLKVECATTIHNTKYCNLTVTGDGSLTGTYTINNKKDSPSPDKSVYKMEGMDYGHSIRDFIPNFLADWADQLKEVVKYLGGCFW